MDTFTVPCNIEKPVVSQSNALIEAIYSLTLSEHRLVTLCIGHIQRGMALTPSTVFEITAKDFSKAYRVKLPDAYMCLSEGADRIAEKAIEVKYNQEGEKPSRAKFPWLAIAEYFDGQGKVQLRFNEFAIPYLTNLSQRFTTYELSEIAKLTSIYAIRLFELLKQFGSIGTRSIEIAWLKQIFKIENEYTRIYDLKRRVIDEAVEQLNERTSLNVNYHQCRRGRIITHFTFVFEHDPNKFTTLKAPKKATKAALSPPAPEAGPAIIIQDYTEPTVACRTEEENRKGKEKMAELRRMRGQPVKP